MEKKLKAMILACIPKAAAPVTFQVSPPLSPVKHGAPVKHGGRPKIPMIPKEARRKPKNSSFEQKEPASPEVSCMGQVKKKTNKKKKNENNKCKPKLLLKPPSMDEDKEKEKEKRKKKVLVMKIFKGDKKVDVVDVVQSKPVVVQSVPSLSQIKKYASGHGGELENFDWRIMCEEEEGGGGGKVIIPHVGAVEPKKEVNLWKRRNKNPPIPLEI